MAEGQPARPLVVDASVALAIVLRERVHRAALDLLRERLGGGLIVPSLFWLEVTNVLARRHRLPGSVIVEAIYELDQLGLRTVATERPATLLVVDLVERHSLTAYDADYLALAISTDADLATTDRRLAAAATAAGAAASGAATAAGAKGRAILVGARTELAEAPAAYHGRVPTWVAWPGSRTYLAELRARLRPTTD